MYCTSKYTVGNKAYPCTKKADHASDHKSGIMTWDDASADGVIYLEPNGTVVDLTSITRFEVIGKAGRLIVHHDVNVQASVQDDGRTLKIFLDK